jgi:hypothetical protein
MENTNESVIPIDDREVKKPNSKLPSSDKLETLKSKAKETTPKNKQKEQETSALTSIPINDTSVVQTIKNEREDVNVLSTIQKPQESILPPVQIIDTNVPQASNVQTSKSIQSTQTDYTDIVKLLSLDDIFINLNLVSKIEVGDKLYVSDKYINIDTSYVQSIARWYYGVDRRSTINFVRLIIAKSFEFCDSLLNSDSKMLFRLSNDLKNSISGLEKLKQTYFADKLVQAEIDVIIESIRAKIESTLITH